MPVDGINKVRQDGRYTLPPELAEKYEGEYLAAVDHDGKITLTVVTGDGSAE